MHLEVSKPISLYDEKLSIRAKGLPVQSLVTFHLKVYDAAEELWQSKATFRVPEEGCLELDVMAPIEGSYTSVDGMGLFNSLRAAETTIEHFFLPSQGLTYTLSVWAEGKKMANCFLHRLLQLPDTQKIKVREEGIVGTLFLPFSQPPLPLIITLGGSNGGLGEQRAQMLSCHGFATLALAYFGCETLPPYLERIDLGYFEKTLKYLETHYRDRIDFNRVGLYGISRGAELSLLLGSLWPSRFTAITAVVPSSVVYDSMRENGQPAWIYHGKEVIPAAPLPPFPRHAQQPISHSPSFLEGAQNKLQFEQAAIAVENIEASILLISGGEDQMWPSQFFAHQILQRLQQEKKSLNIQHLDYPQAGHRFTVAYLPQVGTCVFLPVAGCYLEAGGSVIANVQASNLAWKASYQFFIQNL